jgi:aminoglycoside/choline kinase family phosphotransferase
VSLSSREDQRLAGLEAWLIQLFGSRDFTVTTASADASFRRYFRVTRGNDTWIAMDAPPQREDMAPYVRVARMLVDVGVNAPRVIHLNPEAGYLLNSDLGSRTYLQELEAAGNANPLYSDAITALVRLQSQGDAHARTLPAYDEPLLRREMQLFPEWFCGRHLGIAIEGKTAAELNAVMELLVAESISQPSVFVHRDYHSRNLMVSDGTRYGPNPGILDFQDAVYGPITYDLVSLLRDAYIEWPVAKVQGWIAEFRERGGQAGLNVGRDAAQFSRWFDFMGLQRQLKVMGIFARLWHRDGKAGYLKDIPLTLKYARAATARYPELAPLQELFESRIVPALARVAAPTQS